MLDDALVRRLLLRTAGRDAEAFERLYELTAPLLMGVALRVTARRELAKEVLHDAFVKVWNGATSYDPLATRPVAWLVAIVRNRAIDLVSSADMARVRQFEDDTDTAIERFFDWAPAAEDTVAQGQMHNWLRRCLGELKAGERQALVLAYMHGLSHGDLAEHLSKPLGTIKSWLRRGLESLRGCVEHCMEPR